MKILIAIMSCAERRSHGVNQVIHETSNLIWTSGYEYRFFVGVGPTPKEELYIQDYKVLPLIKYRGLQWRVSERRSIKRR